MKEWLLKPVARRIGGQAGAFAVGLGMSEHYEAGLAGAIMWAVLAAAELGASALNRKKVIELARESWGRN